MPCLPSQRLLRRPNRKALASNRGCKELARVYFEPAACENAVISCRGQGITEIIRQPMNGFLIGVDDGKEIAVSVPSIASLKPVQPSESGHFGA